ncbi:MAG: ATP-binding protein [Desulforhopalus sp.]|nr:ATP-binding protein [Desulforhopalus sp.]
MQQAFNDNQKKIPPPSDTDGLCQLRASRETALQAAREAVRDTTRLTRLITILNDSGPLHLLLDRCLSTLSELFLADVVVLLDPVGTGRFSPLAAIGLPEDIAGLPFSDEDSSLIRLLLQTGLPIRMEIFDSARKVDSQLLDVGAESIIGLPVHGTHSVHGALILARCRPEPFSDADLGLLKTMAYRIGRTLTEAQRSLQFEKLVRSSREINRHLDLQAVAAEAVKTFPVIVSADAAAIILRDPLGQFSCAAQTGLSPSCATTIGLLARQMAESSLFSESEMYSTADMATTFRQLSMDPLNFSPFKAFQAILVHCKDRILGILFAFRYSAIADNSDISQITVLFAEQVSLALENAELYQAMQNELAERKRLEEEKRKWQWQQQQLQKANSLHRMAGAIAHHFNNQLGVVIGNLELATQDEPRDENQAHFMSAAMQGARKAAEVSGLMLTYLGKATGKLVALNLSEVCRQNLPLLEAAATKTFKLTADLPEIGPIINADHNQIQQILTNLVTNAREAVAGNHGAIGISVKTISPGEIPVVQRLPIDWQPQDGSYACLEVWDSGCGIAEEDIEKLFDPFFSHKFTGRGLGLAVVLGIVKAYDGAVAVESKIGQGSRFRVFLPLSKEMIAQKETPTIPAVTPPEETQTKEIKEGGAVLLVDDEEMMRDVASAMLRRLGFEVYQAKDGVEAVEIFLKQGSEIKIVLSDLTMPRMNGWETLTALRQIRPNIPVILTSGYDEAQAIAGDHPEMPQVFLHKPYKVATLKEALAKAMGA